MKDYMVWVHAEAERILGRPLRAGEWAIQVVAESGQATVKRVRGGALAPLVADASDTALVVHILEYDKAAGKARSRKAIAGKQKERERVIADFQARRAANPKLSREAFAAYPAGMRSKEDKGKTKYRATEKTIVQVWLKGL